MDMKKVIAIGALAVSFLAWRMGAMQQQNQIMIALRPNGPGMEMDVDRACISRTIKNLYDALKDENGVLIEPISLPNISRDDLSYALITQVPEILRVHAVFNDRTLAAISALPEQVRKERAQQAARAMAQTAYNPTLLELTKDRFKAAVYLDIPELYERYAKMIADMLISNAGLAVLSRNAAILNGFTVALEEVVAHYIPELWFEVCTLRGHTNWVQSAKFSPDGTLVVTGSKDGTAKIWNAATGAMVWNLVGHNNAVDSAMFSPDGTRVVTASHDRTTNNDRTAKIWNVADGALLRNLVGHTDVIRSAVFSPDSTRVLTASSDRIAKIWNAADGVLLRNLEGHAAWLYSAVFSPDGTRVVTASSDGTAKIWNAANGALLSNLVGHTKDVRSAVFSPDGTRVVTASSDRTAKIWNAANGALLKNLVGHTFWVVSAVFSPDGTRVVTSANDGTAKIWNAANGALLSDLTGHIAWVYSAEFSPDGTRVVTASSDRKAKIWNAADGALLRDLVGHTDMVHSAVFSPDGSRVVTASRDGTAKIWQLLPRSLPGVSDFDATLFARLLLWAHAHHQRITDTGWAPRVLHAIKWNEMNPADRALVQGGAQAAGLQ